MNAEGLLRKQGWRGAGFSLDTSDRGIKKPLLISHKQDQLGLGKKKASHTTDDQWWMRAFDESLQNLGTGQKSTLSQIQEKGINRGGLYGFFVKGEGLKGSIGEESSTPTTGTNTPLKSAVDGSSDDSDSDSGSSSSDDAASDSSKTTKPNKAQNKRKRETEEDASVAKKLRRETGATKSKPRAQAVAEGHVQTKMGPISADEWPKICAVKSRIDKEAKAKVKKSQKASAYGDVTKGEKAVRTAKKQLVKELVVEAILKGDLSTLNPESWTKENILKNYSKIDKGIKAVKKANKKLSKAAGRTEKEERREAKADAAGRARNQSNGLGQAAVKSHLAQLSGSKQADYAARAAEKGQTLEEYILRRIEKKDSKRVEKEAGCKDQKTVAGEEEDMALQKAQKKAEKKSRKGQKDKSEKSTDKAAAGKREKKDKRSSGKSLVDDKVVTKKAARLGAAGVATHITVSA